MVWFLRTFLSFLFLSQSHFQSSRSHFFPFMLVSNYFTLLILENFRRSQGAGAPLSPLWLRQCIYIYSFFLFIFYFLFLKNGGLWRSTFPTRSPQRWRLPHYMDLAHQETTSRNIVHNHKKYLINFEGSTLTKLNVIPN